MFIYIHNFVKWPFKSVLVGHCRNENLKVSVLKFINKNTNKNVTCNKHLYVISSHFVSSHYCSLLNKDQIAQKLPKNQEITVKPCFLLSPLLCGWSICVNRTNSETSFEAVCVRTDTILSPRFIFQFVSVLHRQSSWFPFWCQHRGQRSQRKRGIGRSALTWISLHRKPCDLWPCHPPTP